MTQKEKELYGNEVKFAFIKAKAHLQIFFMQMKWTTIIPIIVWYNKHTKWNWKIKISDEGDVYGDGSVFVDNFGE